MTGVVYLGGGGTGQDEALLWAEMLPGCRRLLSWPLALEGEMLGGAEAWLRDHVHQRGSSAVIDTWLTLAGRDPVELDGVDLLFVGGGNTFSLLHHLQVHGFVAPVRRWVAARTVGPDAVWTVTSESSVEHPPGSRLLLTGGAAQGRR